MPNDQPDNEKLLAAMNSLQGLSREVIGWFKDPETEWVIKAATYGDEFKSLLHIALGKFEILMQATDGATVCVLTDDHHEILLKCIRACEKDGCSFETAVGRLSGEDHELIQQARDYLFEGSLNVIDATLNLPELHRTVFIDMFFGGNSPSQVGDALGLTREEIETIFDEAVSIMAGGHDEDP